MKKLFTLLMAVVMTCSAMAVNVWDGTSEPWTNGSGTADDPYLIETAANLAYLAEKVNEGYEAQGMAVFAETHFFLTDDLDLNNINWTPIGNINTNMEGFYFAGVFEGDYHVISNLTIQSDAEVVGLFAGAADGPDGFWNPTVIERLFVTNANINSTGMGAGGIVGAIAGYTVVVQCGFSGTITVNNNGSYCGAGGIVALAAQNTRIRECSFSGSINVTNNGGFTTAAGAGGIVGIAMDNSFIEACYNTGTISANAMLISVAAGIVGATLQENEVAVNRCYNVGSVNALTKGGIFGMVSPINPTKGEASIMVTNCYYLNSCGGTTNYGTSMSSDQMQTEDFKDQLDARTHQFVMDNGTNNGYPIHGLASFRSLRAFDITCHSAKLSALIHQGNDSIARAIFLYKHWEAEEWIELEVPTDGYVEVELEGLEPDTYYELGMELQFPDGVSMSSAPRGFQTLAYDAVESLTAPDVLVYPNPATDIVHIQGVEADEIQVYNALGQLVKTVRSTNQIDVSDLADGHYLLRITSANPLTEYVLPLSKRSH